MDSILQNIQLIIFNDLEILGLFEFERKSKTTAPQGGVKERTTFFLFNTNKYVVLFDQSYKVG